MFTDDMDHCMFTGYAPVEHHHIFGGSNRSKCEKYGFIAPLRPDLHPNGVFAESYYEEHYGTREDFRREFGKSYL